MEKNLMIVLTVQDAEVIMKALVKQPYEAVASTINIFDTQVRKQLSEKTETGENKK